MCSGVYPCRRSNYESACAQRATFPRQAQSRNEDRVCLNGRKKYTHLVCTQRACQSYEKTMSTLTRYRPAAISSPEGKRFGKMMENRGVGKEPGDNEELMGAYYEYHSERANSHFRDATILSAAVPRACTNQEIETRCRENEPCVRMIEQRTHEPCDFHPAVARGSCLSAVSIDSLVCTFQYRRSFEQRGNRAQELICQRIVP